LEVAHVHHVQPPEPPIHLLVVLPESERERLFPHLERVPLPLDEARVFGGRLNHIYFPTTAIVSLLYVMENGASAEIAVVGNEGIHGEQKLVSMFGSAQTVVLAFE
jgi:hypothetical protein